ncbi:solute carrier family 10 member 6 [Ornithorhynchus anatinus]|uniref:Solute carrier family 10 member 6 n=1 Tax=Ornithorhynchus anatinus TaxID=9258 RepID=A0A6I8NIU8_ORNAN|nr:solute carrier family 10 member 6 [Ornithorhynchus anatinus]
MAKGSGGPGPPLNRTEAGPALVLGGGLELAFTGALTAMMALVMFALGCTVDGRKLWGHIRRPWGIAVGLLCQFGLMPLTAYLLVTGFSLKPAHAIAVLIMGCCPGGTISNIFTYWVDGDMDLSISLTTCSTVAALGLLPLCLSLYTPSWGLEPSLTVPYQNIGIALLCLIIPVGCGVFVNHMWPKQSRIILRAGAIVGGVLLLVVAVACPVVYKGSWNLDVSLLIISIIFPLIGYVAGFLLSLLAQQPWKRCRTISLETGAQNIQMCSTMLQLSFSADQLAQMFTFPLIYGFFQLLDGFLVVVVYQLFKRLKANKEKDLNEAESSPKDEANAVFQEAEEEEVVRMFPGAVFDNQSQQDSGNNRTLPKNMRNCMPNGLNILTQQLLKQEER